MSKADPTLPSEITGDQQLVVFRSSSVMNRMTQDVLPIAQEKQLKDNADAQPHYERAQAHYEEGRYEEAMAAYRIAAELGHMDAQYCLADMMVDGKCGEVDIKSAGYWFRRAADQGYTRAMCLLGWLYDFCAEFTQKNQQYEFAFFYYFGDGTFRDNAQAARWYRMAAEKGDSVAQHRLGCMYRDGRGVQQDSAKAERWLRVAAKKANEVLEDHDSAMLWYRMAATTKQGKIAWMTPNPEKHLHWIRIAAEQGHSSAQSDFVDYCYQRIGKSQDYNMKIYWWCMATERRNLESKLSLGDIGHSTFEGLNDPENQPATMTIVEDEAGKSYMEMPAVDLEPRRGRFAIVSANDLVASNNKIGEINPEYPSQLQPPDRSTGFLRPISAIFMLYPSQLQPRDRSTGANINQINQISGNLKVGKLSAENASVTTGAPVVTRSGVVLSGNDRTIAIGKAYRDNKADEYRNYVREHARRMGVSEEAIALAGNQPVLVRVIDDLSSFDDAVAFVVEANTSAFASMNAIEKSKTDVRRFLEGKAVWKNYVPNDEPGGNLDTPANETFLKPIKDGMTANERNVMICYDKLSQLGESRLKAAIIQYVYRNDHLIDALFGKSDTTGSDTTGASAQIIKEALGTPGQPRGG